MVGSRHILDQQAISTVLHNASVKPPKDHAQREANGLWTGVARKPTVNPSSLVSARTHVLTEDVAPRGILEGEDTVI